MKTDTNNEIPETRVRGEYIELCKLLKYQNWVAGGGEAKNLIAEGYVLLNGEVETRKRKKIFDGDVVEFNNLIVRVRTETDNNRDG